MCRRTQIFFACLVSLQLVCGNLPAGLQNCSVANATGKPGFIQPRCLNITRDAFNPNCLPEQLAQYSMLKGMINNTVNNSNDPDNPILYNSWMLAEVCGMDYMAFRARDTISRSETFEKVAISILENWGIFAAGTILGSCVMTCFYLAPPGRRCLGLFEEEKIRDDVLVLSDASWNPQTCLLCSNLLILFPLALMLFIAMLGSFITEVQEFRAMWEVHMKPMCYSSAGLNFVLPKPSDVCRTVILLDMPARAHMLDWLALSVFTGLDLLLIIVIAGQSTLNCAWAIAMVCCCWRGCMWWRTTATKQPHWCCGHCNPLLACCRVSSSITINCLFLPVAFSLYLLLGLTIALFAYGLFVAAIAFLIYLFQWCFREVVDRSCGDTCIQLPLPKSWYLKTLFPWRHTYKSESYHRRDDRSYYKRTKADLEESELGFFLPPADIQEENLQQFNKQSLSLYEYAQVMIVPYPFIILVVPVITLVGFVSCMFVVQDFAFQTLAWATADLDWYKQRMGSGTNYWNMRWSLALGYLEGLSQGWICLAKEWVRILVASVTFRQEFYKGAIDFVVRGANPSNLFYFWGGTAGFDKFQSSMRFYRFLLSFVFTCIRTTGLINIPATEIPGYTVDPYGDHIDMDHENYDPFRGY